MIRDVVLFTRPPLHKQEEPSPPQRGGAHFAFAVLGVSRRPANGDEKLSLNFDDNFDEEFAFTGQLPGSSQSDFHSQSDWFTMIVSGASDHMIYAELIPRLRNRVKDYKTLKKSKTIGTAGNEKAFATATGIIWVYIVDQAGQRFPGRISAMFVPGLGRNLFSVKAMQPGVTTILETGTPNLQFDNTYFASAPSQKTRTRAYALTKYLFFALRGKVDISSKTPAVVPAAHAGGNAK